MSTAKRKARSTAPDETARPPEPSWRQPPARPRKRQQRNQTTAPSLAAPAGKIVRSVAPRASRPALPLREAVRYLMSFLFTAGVVAGLVSLLRAPQLAVSATSTQIGGAQRIAMERVYQVSGLEGQSIFLVRPAEVAARIGQEPGIAGVDIHVRLPNQVLIDVREHVPIVAWHGITTTVWLTADGIEVPQAGAAPPLQLADRTGLAIAASRAHWPRVLPAAVALHQALPQVTELYYGQLEGLYFRSPEGWTVWLGDTGEVATKLALLKSAGREITAQGAQPEVIDLRFGGSKALWW